MRIEPYLHRNAARWPNKPAIIDGERHVSYAQFALQVECLAGGLALLGIRRGDRIVFVLENGADAALSFFAAWRLGAIACPLHPSIKTDKLAEILASTEAAAIVYTGKLRATLEAACAKAKLAPVLIATGPPPVSATAALAPITTISFDSLLESPMPGPLSDEPDAADIALLIHTSGSTGTPKGVMLTHANLHFACDAVRTYLGNDDNDIVLSVLPLSFGYGITQMVTMIMSGGTLVIERSFAFPRAILARLAELKVTGLPLVPAMAGMIAAMADLAPGVLPHLRYITSAAAAMPPATTQSLRRLFPDTDLFLMYGQTECIRTAYLPPADVDHMPSSVGRPLAGTSIAIIGDDGLPVADGEMGELQVCGPHVMAGYWRNDTATAQSIVERDGLRWLRTGDLFRRDADGYLHFIARQDDIIKTRGEKVSPQEVERVLYALPGVLEAAVEGVPDPLFGQIVKAHVVLVPGAVLTERAIQRHCADHLEDFMVPKLFEFRDALPKTATGKIRLSLAQVVPDDTEGKVA